MSYEFESVLVDIEEHIAHVRMNKPAKSNAMGQVFWEEMRELFPRLDEDETVRVVILSGEGKNFTAGIDLNMFASMESQFNGKADPGRAREILRRGILDMQEAFTVIERCRKPVLAAIHGACIGGGIDMVTACDMRYCSADAFFCVKEADLAIVADVGTLQRLPKIIPEGIARELAFTARNMTAQEAEKVHLVNRVYADRETMHQEVLTIARNIAQKSPLTIRGTKEILNYSRDHSVAEGLNFVATWNSAVLFSHDIIEAMQATLQKRKPEYKN